MKLFFRKPKVFCIGANKTGTTSLKSFLQSAGYKVAPQRPAELMIKDWAQRDFRDLIKFAKRHEAFQDIPFSLPFTFQALDSAFPDSKFILTIRTSAETWYSSLLRATQKRLGLTRVPTAEDLENDPYVYRGFTRVVTRMVYGNKTTSFDRPSYLSVYESHNEAVCRYFEHRPEDLLVIDLSSPEASEKLHAFLRIPAGKFLLPHLNSSQ